MRESRALGSVRGGGEAQQWACLPRSPTSSPINHLAIGSHDDCQAGAVRSHALCQRAINLFLALRAPTLLFESIFLRANGLAMLVSYLVLAHRYWFKVPIRCVALATALHVAACEAGAR